MGSSAIPVLIGLILLHIHKISECQRIEVTPDPSTNVIFSKKPGQGLDCTVCKNEDSSQSCDSSLRLTESKTTSVSFNCSQPGDVFTVEINQDIDCSSSACSSIAVHPDATRFLEFSRSFTWDVKVHLSKMFHLDFPAPGMRQIKPSESCPDQHTYSITSYQRTGPISIGSFCRNGTISRIQVWYRGRISLEVPKGTPLNPSDFRVSIGPASTGLVEVDVKLPRAESSVDFFTPNYGTGYYNDYKVKWNFAVEPMVNFTIEFKAYAPPECQKKEVTVDYALGEKTSLTTKPTDIQPKNKQGDFSLTLNNCDAKSAAKVPGLSMHIMVGVFRGGIPYLCTVDLQNEEGLSLEIVNTNPQSYCEMRSNFVVQEKIVVPVGSKVDLYFLDCPAQDLRLTATKTIDFSGVSARSVSGTPLIIPPMKWSLPVALNEFSWLLRVPDQTTLDLTSAQRNLHQSVPDKPCKEKVSLLVSESLGSSMGQFCSPADGAIQKIQIRGNVSITVSPNTVKDLSQETDPFLNIALSPEITENVIYTVSPLISGPAYLASPYWPDAMQPSSSASWIINVPPEYRANLWFTNVSKPTCDSGHAELEISPLDSSAETQKWREDQSFPDSIVQQTSFYLNMSNCEPASGRYALLTKIIVQKESKKILAIILAVVGAVLALLIVALVVVCVIRKKNKPSGNRSSIYIPKGKPVLPGNATFPKSRTDNESHVYASIDETIYNRHLDTNHPADSNNGTWTNGHQVDTYRPFLGPTDSIPTDQDLPDGYSLDRGRDKDVFQPFLTPPNTFNLPRPRSPLISQGSLGFEDRRMVDNELNTFKAAGDINPIRLSTDECKLRPQMDSDSDSYHEPEYEEAM